MEGKEDAQLTIGLEDETEYQVLVDGTDIGRMSTNVGGKLNIGVELSGAGEVTVQIRK